MCYLQAPYYGTSYSQSSFFGEYAWVLGAVVVIFIILAIRNRTRNLVALSLSKFVFNPEAEDFLIIEGRKTGFWQWVLVQLKLGNRYQILVNKDQISYSEDSARGNSLLLTPLSKIASTGGGYSKPLGLLITAALLVVFGLWLLFSTATMGIISILVAALLVVLYHFRKSFFINVQPVSGAVFGFTFKRSIIENVEIDTELIKRGIAFLNEKVIEASK
ncbi:hypothetical protein FACS189426_05940 [Bacteroidia bacterium]|nr:hypothetical protein FACS189426_05940 [Bacteroidia bacterium]GHV70783.1 hypothetical protein FACS189420_3310 [Bacteroidia bacterium]